MLPARRPRALIEALRHPVGESRSSPRRRSSSSRVIRAHIARCARSGSSRLSHDEATRPRERRPDRTIECACDSCPRRATQREVLGRSRRTMGAARTAWSDVDVRVRDPSRRRARSARRVARPRESVFDASAAFRWVSPSSATDASLECERCGSPRRHGTRASEVSRSAPWQPPSGRRASREACVRTPRRGRRACARSQARPISTATRTGARASSTRS